MEKSQLIKYFYLGTVVRYLQDAKEGVPIFGYGRIAENIEAFFIHLGNIGLPVTTRTDAFSELKAFGSQFQTLKKEEDPKLSSSQAKQLSEILTRARETLVAEVMGISVFLVTPKRIDVNKLLDDVPGLFSPNIFQHLPEIAQFDFYESGRCMAFERGTAAAFHMLRGTEAVIRNFYKMEIRQKRIKSLLWGDITADLRKRAKTKKYDALLNNLDNIRITYRNPTQHPDAKYDIQEAQDLWGLCVEVVNRMTKILFPNP
jgi:hypothetical protein